jgi:hypothetical protein
VTIAADPTYQDLFPEAEPIFVLGAARSGTSIACEALRYGAGLPGKREGFLFSTAYLLMSHLDGLWQRIGPGLEHFADEERGVRDRERALARFEFGAFLRHCLRHFHELSAPAGERVWVDKTPDIYMVHATPILAAAYPRGRWVFMQRNGIEVLDSRRRTHPEMTFEEGCRDWAMVIADWHRARTLLAGRFLEIDQREVALQGPATAARLAAFLGLDAAQQAGIAAVFATHRPGRTTTRGYAEVLTLATAPWPDEQKATFRALCGDAMRAAGYEL